MHGRTIPQYWWHSIWRLTPLVVVLGLTGFLSLLGLLVLYSIGQGQGGGTSQYFVKQSVWLALAVCVLPVAMRIDLEWLRKLALPLALVTAVVLVLVLVPGIGHKVNGARRWIQLGPMNMQVSDFVRLSYIVVLAHYLADNKRVQDTFVRGFVVPCAMIGATAGLILLQPDFGTAFLFGVVGAALLFLNGVRLPHLVPVGIAALVAFAVLVYHDPVRLKRITSFLDVEGNRSEGTYQLWQGILGFGTGGVSGVGLGNGRQHMAFLPEAHTDFIFPIIGEELGLLATGGVLLAFGLLFVLGWWQLQRAPNLYQFLLTAGALLFIVFQALINMGVSTGVLPTKGMSLPMVSYGGSNLVVTYALIGILLNGCWRWNRPVQWRAHEIQ
jgi:cell division protein FtsW